MDDDLKGLEERGWQALASDGATARTFYDEVLDDAVLMLLPGGLVLGDRAAALEAMGGAPWASYALEDVRVLRPTEDVGVVAYGVRAQREDAPPYAALVSSLYVRRGSGWRLSFHQQTPR